MEKRGLGVIISSVFIALGAWLMINTFSGMTGLVVMEFIGSVASSVLGLILFIGGIMLLAYEGRNADFSKSIDSIVDLYEIGNIDSMTAAERINKLRAGKQVEGVKYAGEKMAVIDTRRGNVSIRVDDKEKALDLVSALYWTSLINDRGNMKKSNIEIAAKKIPYLDELEGGLTQYLKDYSEEHRDDFERMART